MAKIIPLYKLSKRPLTPLMVTTLRRAVTMQNNKVEIAQGNLDGSFMALLKRELIDCKTVQTNGDGEVSWFVTQDGIDALNNIKK